MYVAQFHMQHSMQQKNRYRNSVFQADSVYQIKNITAIVFCCIQPFFAYIAYFFVKMHFPQKFDCMRMYALYAYVLTYIWMVQNPRISKNIAATFFMAYTI